MKKKKVGLLISTMNNGGAERVVSRLSFMLKELYEIHVILFEDTYMKYECNSDLINMDIKARKNNVVSKLILIMKRSLKLAKIKKEYELDVVISFLDSPNFVNILSKTKRCKTIVSVRNYSKLENKKLTLGKLSEFTARWLYNRADKIVPVSKVIGGSLVEHYGLDKAKIHTIYNPYDCDDILKLATETIEPEYEAFLSSDHLIGTVGRQMYQKGHWHLIKAFKLVHEKNSLARLVIVGNDEQNGLDEKLIKDYGLEQQVLLMGYQKNPYKYVDRSKVYVLSSLYEGFPNSMVEAMVCGIPIVAADCKSGPREILFKDPDIEATSKDIEFADYGILVPPLNPVEDWHPDHIDASEVKLAEAITQMLDDRSLQTEYGEKAAIRARDFDYEASRKAFEHLIDT